MGDRQQAVDFFNKAATSLNDLGNPERLRHSYQLFSSACMLDPTWSEAFYQAGNNNSDMNLIEAAVACWRRALENNPDPTMRAKILANLGWRLHTLGHTMEALPICEEAIKLDPNLHLGYINLSCIHQLLCNAEETVAYGKKGWELQKDDPVAEICYAFALLFTRHFQEGYERFESRFPYKLKSYLQFPYPKWHGEPGQTVYLVADQGLGDTLSYARFVKAASKRAKYIHASVQPELMRLFQHAFVGLENVNFLPTPCPFPAADAWTTFVSLPYALKLSDDEILHSPQIEAPPIHMPINWKVSDRKLHIGIAWAGSPLNDINPHRSIPIQQFFDLFKVPGVQLYSLQVGEKNQQMYDAGGAALIVDLARYVRDVVDTVAMIQKLDLVITCESALGHIAALANKECWVPYSYMGRDYRVGLSGDDMMWTPKHRIFRQGPDRQWGPVFEQICAALEEKVHGSAGKVGRRDQEARSPRIVAAQ